MDANEIDPVTAFRPPEAIETRPRLQPRPLTVARATWMVAKTGFWCISYIFGPIVAIGVILGLSLTAFGMGFGESWGMLKIIGNAVGSYIAVAIWGTLLGGVVGLLAGLVSKAVRVARLALCGRPAPTPVVSSVADKNEGVLRGLDPPPRRRLLWPWLIGVPGVLLLMLAFAASAILSRVIDNRLANAIAAADRDDPYWRLDDLMAHREPVPDEENSAIVVAGALVQIPEDWPQCEVSKCYERLPALPANLRLDDAMTEAFRDELDTYSDAVVTLRTVPGYRRGRHELELARALIDTPLPETQAARTPARLLRIDAAIRAHDGDLDGALDSCCAILGVARSIGDEPFAISQRVRVAIGEVGLAAARRVLGQGELSDKALARLEAAALDELSQPLLLYGIRGERATLTELIRRIGDGELPISAVSDEKQSEPSAPPTVNPPWAKRMFEHQRAIGLEWTNEAVAIARRTPREAAPLWKAWEAKLQDPRHDRIHSYIARLPLLLMPVLSANVSAHSHHRASLGATAILLAGERHRRKTADWPASIDAIGPDLLPTRPLDPYSGRPFRMERREGQILIHSLGPNLVDEHGAYESKRWREGSRDDVGTSGWDVPLRRQSPNP